MDSKSVPCPSQGLTKHLPDIFLEAFNCTLGFPSTIPFKFDGSRTAMTLFAIPTRHTAQGHLELGSAVRALNIHFIHNSLLIRGLKRRPNMAALFVIFSAKFAQPPLLLDVAALLSLE